MVIKPKTCMQVYMLLQNVICIFLLYINTFLARWGEIKVLVDICKMSLIS